MPLEEASSRTLTIHGLVDRPLVFTVDELRRLPSRSRIHFLECSGNSGGEWSGRSTESDVQRIHGLTSCSEWTSVPLSMLLRECSSRGRPAATGSPGRESTSSPASRGPDAGRSRASRSRSTAARPGRRRSFRCRCLAIAHTRFRWSWKWDGREAFIASRCTDDTGYTQPPLAELIKIRGTHSQYHNNGIQVWKVAADGHVINGNRA